jgi:hypothetical protein
VRRLSWGREFWELCTMLCYAMLCTKIKFIIVLKISEIDYLILWTTTLLINTNLKCVDFSNDKLINLSLYTELRRIAWWNLCQQDGAPFYNVWKLMQYEVNPPKLTRTKRSLPLYLLIFITFFFFFFILSNNWLGSLICYESYLLTNYLIS